MRVGTPQHAFLARLRSAAIPAGVNRKCPTCGIYYETSDPGDSYPHNNH